MHANNCANAPKKIAHGITNDVPDVIPNFCVEATRVTIANPNNPNALGSAVVILIFVLFINFFLSKSYCIIVSIYNMNCKEKRYKIAF